MEAGTELSSQLRLADLDAAEFADLLSSLFGGSTHVGRSEIVYPASVTSHAIKLVYDKNGLRSVVAGPGLTDAYHEEIRRRVDQELLSGNLPKVFAFTLFADVPVNGAFRYQDRFQILPSPESAPRPPFIMALHPFTLEVAYVGSVNSSIDLRRRLRVVLEIELLLVGLLPWMFGSLGRIEHHWMMLHDESTGAFSYEFLQEGYYSGAEGPKENFTALDQLPSLQFVDVDAYYGRRGISGDETLDLPANVVRLADSFYALSMDDRRRFLRSCFWFRHSRRVHSLSRSAAFTALISAIECFIVLEKGAESCSTCGKSLGKGPTSQFKDLVDRLIPDPGKSADRKELYRVRSKLSHGGALLSSDLSLWSPTLDPDRIDEWSHSQRAWTLVKLVLVNWLTDNSGNA